MVGGLLKVRRGHLFTMVAFDADLHMSVKAVYSAFLGGAELDNIATIDRTRTRLLFSTT